MHIVVDGKGRSPHYSLRGASAKHFWDGLERFDVQLKELAMDVYTSEREAK